MVKIKIVAISHNYDYASEREINEFADALDWTEVEEKEVSRILAALKHRHKLKSDPFYGKSLIVLEEVVPNRIDLWDLVAKCEEEVRKEEQARQKRAKALEDSRKKKEELALTRKRKMLEKLQKELGANIELEK